MPLVDFESSAMRLRLKRSPSNDGFGFGLQLLDRGQPPVLQIQSIANDCEAKKSGLIRDGDIILRINNIDVSKCTYDEAIQILASTSMNQYSSFLIRAPYGYVTRLITTFEENGSSKTIRITEHLNQNQQQQQQITTNHSLSVEKNQTNSDNNHHHLTPKMADESTTAASTTANQLRQRKGSICIGQKPIRIRNVATSQITVDTLHQSAKQPLSCSEAVCLGSLMKQTKEHLGICPTQVPNLDVTTTAANNQQQQQSQTGELYYYRSKDQVLNDAYQFMEQYYASIKRLHTQAHRNRLREIESEVRSTGTYQLKQTELIFGAKLGWRNAPRCIGRIQWSKLQVFDARSCKTAHEIFEAICNQIKYATNRGNLRSAITIFPQRINGREDYRVWNQQLISYAGYVVTKNLNNSNDNLLSMDHHNDHNHCSTNESTTTIIGDPMNVEFTQICLKLGWKGSETKWDILPIVISVPGEDPQIFPLSEDLILRVPLVHPKYKWFEELNLQWYALPAVSSMKFDVGGIEFTACPFSGWYMDTEIAVRDLCDIHRYNILPEIAKHMSLDINSNVSLWKDRAVIEVNTAVLYSFQKSNVTIVDHHTAAESFMKHLENENRLRGGCPADWVWIVPPISGSLTPVFHQEMLNYELKPAYKYQEPAWKSHVWKNNQDHLSISSAPRKLRFKEIAKAVKFTSNLFGKALSKRIKATILYATETGRSEQFAKRLGQIFSHVFNVSVYCMDQYDMLHLEHETLLLCVISTFGNGDPPENGESFAKQLQAIKMTGDTAPDLDRESISLPISYLRYSSIDTSEQDSIQNPNSPIISANNTNNDDYNFAFVDHVGPLSNVRFAVFALGSSAYPNFCSFGRYLDTMLSELGGERITRLGIGDELCGQEQSFYEWSAEVFEQACEVFCLTDELDMNVVTRLAAQKPLQWCKENVLLDEYDGSDFDHDNENDNVDGETPITIENEQETETKRIQKALSKLSNNKKVNHYKLIERVNLHGKNDDEHVPNENNRPTIRVTLRIDHAETGDEQLNDEIKPNIHYYPGDHLAVYPENSSELVQKIINRLTLLNPSIESTKQYVIKIKSQHSSIDNPLNEHHNNNIFGEPNKSAANHENEQNWVLHDRLPSPVTLKEALTRYLDITNPPTQRLLSILSEHATDQFESDLLKNLSKDSVSYENWKAKNFPNFLEILTEFSSINPPLEFIFTQLPVLKPRHYSISSSPLTQSSFQLDLTVAVIQYHTESGSKHYGVCSNFLNDKPIGGDVFAFIRSAPNFRLPKERKVPIIMVGPGTGIAPFRSFWEHRSKLKELNTSADYGKMTLYFGCRYPSMQLYANEIEIMIQNNIIKEYHVAYSRRSNHPKQYVQDIMRKLSKEIFNDLIEKKGHIYVCGDVSMAQDVNKTLRLILQENGVQDAEMTLLSLKETMHYHEDIFGITLRTAEVTNRNRSDAAKRTFSNS